MLPEHNFFVNRISSDGHFFPVLQDSVKSDFFHKLFIDPPEKGESLFLKFIAMYFWNLQSGFNYVRYGHALSF